MKIHTTITSARRLAGVMLAVTVLAVTGCKNPLPTRSVTLAPALDKPPRTAILQSGVVGSSLSGYRRTLDAGTHWMFVGRIAEGEVWAPVDTVLTAEARHVHEANMVVADGTWVGFYLVVEKSYSPLRIPVPINLTDGGKQ